MFDDRARDELYIDTARDVSVIRRTDGFLVTACDTLGAIGAKPADVVQAPEEVCGAYTLRVCLSELAAVGAVPLIVTSLVCNEWESTGRKILDGIRAELTDNGYQNVRVNGSTEENMRTVMTALGITVVGFAEHMRWRKTLPGDRVLVVGIPRVGKAVLEHGNELLRPSLVRFLCDDDAVGDVIPCGSRGVRHELDVLAQESGLRIRLASELGIDLDASAGPATCAVVTVHDTLVGCPLPVATIGITEKG